MRSLTEFGEKYLTIDDVCYRYKVGSSSVYRWINDGDFPRPIKLSARCARWRLSEILEHEEKLKQAG